MRITVFQDGHPEELEERLKSLGGVEVVQIRSGGGILALEFDEEADPWKHPGAIGRALDDLVEEELISSFR